MVTVPRKEQLSSLEEALSHPPAGAHVFQIPGVGTLPVYPPEMGPEDSLIYKNYQPLSDEPYAHKQGSDYLGEVLQNISAANDNGPPITGFVFGKGGGTSTTPGGTQPLRYRVGPMPTPTPGNQNPIQLIGPKASLESDVITGQGGVDTMAGGEKRDRVWGARSPRLTKLDILSGMDVGKTTPWFALPPGRKLGVSLGAGKVNDPELVRQWQDFLKENGFMDKNERSDGSFGPNTRLATRLFQGVNGIKQDGVVGDQTLAAMKQHLDLVGPPAAPDPNAPRKVKTETVVGVPDIAPNDLFPSEPDKTTLPDAVVPMPLPRPERTLSAEEMAGTTRRLPRMEPPQQGGGSGVLVVPQKADATPPLRLTSPHSAAAPTLGAEIAKIPATVEVALPPERKLGSGSDATQILMSDLRLGLQRPDSPLDAKIQQTASSGNFGREAAAMSATRPPPYSGADSMLRGASPTGTAFGDSGRSTTAGDAGATSAPASRFDSDFGGPAPAGAGASSGSSGSSGGGGADLSSIVNFNTMFPGFGLNSDQTDLSGTLSSLP